ncbi:hypothetical protein GEMRC1_008119 [Eukaryota sp. GEM-RC1]
MEEVLCWPQFPLYDRSDERKISVDKNAVRKLLANARKKAYESKVRAKAGSLGSVALEKARRRRTLKQLVQRVSIDSRSAWRTEFARRRRLSLLEERKMKARQSRTASRAMLNASTKIKHQFGIKVEERRQPVRMTLDYSPPRGIVPIHLVSRLSSKKTPLSLGHILRKQQAAFIRRRIHLLGVKRRALSDLNRCRRVAYLKKTRGSALAKHSCQPRIRAKKRVRFNKNLAFFLP